MRNLSLCCRSVGENVGDETVNQSVGEDSQLASPQQRDVNMKDVLETSNAAHSSIMDESLASVLETTASNPSLSHINMTFDP